MWTELTRIISKMRLSRSPWVPCRHSSPFSWLDWDNRFLGDGGGTKWKKPRSPDHSMYKIFYQLVPWDKQETTFWYIWALFFGLFVTVASIVIDRSLTRMKASLRQCHSYHSVLTTYHNSITECTYEWMTVFILHLYAFIVIGITFIDEYIFIAYGKTLLKK